MSTLFKELKVKVAIENLYSLGKVKFVNTEYLQEIRKIKKFKTAKLVLASTILLRYCPQLYLNISVETTTLPI